MPKKKAVHEMLNGLAAAERDFLTREFLSPVVRGSGVQVRIAGVRCKLRVTPSDFEGWGVFQPLSHSEARLVRRAGMSERRGYLEVFPAVALVLCRQDGRSYRAMAANKGDRRFQIEGLVPVRLIEEADLFDIVRARFDGAQFWFEAADSRADPGTAVYLRQALGGMIEPERLARAGMTPEQQTAYTLNYAARLEAQLADERQRGERRLHEALAHAGAQLRDYTERGDVYRVTFTVDGRQHTSVVKKDDLTVQAAGICLAGHDRHFDLHSLVGVLREGHRGGRIHWVGN